MSYSLARNIKTSLGPRGARRPLSGVSGGPRGGRISLYAMGGTDTYTAQTPCSSIPAGDPYRAPPNQCLATDGKTVMNFDAQGNVYAPTPWTTYLAIGAAALAVAHFLK